MKRIIISLFIFTAFSANAKVKVPVCFPCETIEKVQELPTDSEIHKMAGTSVSVAYLNNEYGALWIPVWNAKGRYVLTDITKTLYYEIDAETAKILKEKHNFDINQDSPLSFWKKVGGKIIIGLLIGLLIWGQLPSKKEKKEENLA
jgi:hypothetical protein